MKTQSQSKDKHINFLKKLRESATIRIALILLVLCVFLAIAEGKAFLTNENLLSVFRQFSFIGIMAIGECLVIITGGIDLSVGSIFAFSGVIGSLAMTSWGLGFILGLIVGLVAGAGFGLINGLLITKLKLPPFIATLGTMSIARGLSYAVTKGYPVSDMPDAFKFIGQGHILGIPAPIILLIMVTIIIGIFLHLTITGRRIFAIGGNEEASRVSGISVKKEKILVYTLCGLLAGLAGLATAARLNVAQSTAGAGSEMDAIAAVIIGGASLSGGVGNVAGPILGAAIMGVLRNGLVLMSVSAYWQQTVIGIVIIVAVTIDKMRYEKL